MVAPARCTEHEIEILTLCLKPFIILPKELLFQWIRFALCNFPKWSLYLLVLPFLYRSRIFCMACCCCCYLFVCCWLSLTANWFFLSVCGLENPNWSAQEFGGYARLVSGWGRFKGKLFFLRAWAEPLGESNSFFYSETRKKHTPGAVFLSPILTQPSVV